MVRLLFRGIRLCSLRVTGSMIRVRASSLGATGAAAATEVRLRNRVPPVHLALLVLLVPQRRLLRKLSLRSARRRRRSRLTKLYQNLIPRTRLLSRALPPIFIL